MRKTKRRDEDDSVVASDGNDAVAAGIDDDDLADRRMWKDPRTRRRSLLPEGSIVADRRSSRNRWERSSLKRTVKSSRLPAGSETPPGTREHAELIMRDFNT